MYGSEIMLIVGVNVIYLYHNHCPCNTLINIGQKNNVEKSGRVYIMSFVEF